MTEPIPDESGVSLPFPLNAKRGVEEVLHPAFARLCDYTSKYSATSYGCGRICTGRISFSRL
jgi:hypothetical protein